MTYGIEILPSARKEIAKLAPAIRRQVDAAIVALAQEPMPRPPKSKRLRGALKGLFRLRVGDYLVIYRVDGGRLMVLIVRVAHRREVYRHDG